MLPPGSATSTSTSSNTASTATAKVSSRLAPISPNAPPVSHAASVIANAPEGEQAHQHQRVVAESARPGARSPIGSSTSAISSEPATTAGASS